jgi:hypothetical protein
VQNGFPRIIPEKSTAHPPLEKMNKYSLEFDLLDDEGFAAVVD